MSTCTTRTQEEKLFASLDTDESQDISVSEVLKMLHSQGFSSLGEDHVRQVVARFDQDSSGTIDLSEFRKLYEALLIDSSQRAISELPISSSNAIGDLTTALRKSGAQTETQVPEPEPEPELATGEFSSS